MEEETSWNLEPVSNSPQRKGQSLEGAVILSSPTSCIYRFIKKFREKKPRMKQILRELQQTASEDKGLQEGVKTGRNAAIAGVTVGAVGAVVALAAAPFTGGVSLAIFGAGAAGSVAGSVTGLAATTTAAGVLEKKRTAMDQFKKSLAEFVEIAESLESELEDLKVECRILQRQADGVRSLMFLKLEADIEKLSLSIAQLVKVTTCAEQADVCQEVYDHMVEILSVEEVGLLMLTQ